VGLLDHDDELTPWALSEVAKLLNRNPNLDFIYSDEDKLEPGGRRSEPFFKPDFSPDLLMSMNYITHFSVFRRELLDKIGGFRKGVEGSQDYDLILRASEDTKNIAHIPKILYHWRKIRGSSSSSTTAKVYAYRAAVKALEEALPRRKQPGKVEMLAPGRYRVRYVVKEKPLVSIIIPTKDKVNLLRRCVESIREKSTYTNYEIIVVDNNSVEKATGAYLEQIKNYPNTQVLTDNEPFNFSRINNFAASHACGDFLLLLNNDTEVITRDWLEEMLSHAQQQEVGAVGVKLLFPKKNLLQHAGVIVGLGGVAGHAFYGLPAENPGYMGLATVTRNYAAVTAACMMLRHSVFDEVGGLDEELDVAYNDVDLCLKIVEKGYYIVWTPHAVLYHHEWATRGQYQPERNIRYFCAKWHSFLEKGDPFYNPNLALDRADFMVKVQD
jgi:GT2 family glycosyltransferase